MLLLRVNTHILRSPEPGTFCLTTLGRGFIRGEWTEGPQRSGRKGRVSVHRGLRDAASKGLELFALGAVLDVLN